MDGSPSSVLSFGFGSWGSIGLVVTIGFGIPESVATLAPLKADVLDIRFTIPRLDLPKPELLDLNRTILR